MITVKLTKKQVQAAVTALACTLAGGWGEGDTEDCGTTATDAEAALDKLLDGLNSQLEGRR